MTVIFIAKTNIDNAFGFEFDILFDILMQTKQNENGFSSSSFRISFSFSVELFHLIFFLSRRHGSIPGQYFSFEVVSVNVCRHETAGREWKREIPRQLSNELTT